MGKRVGLKEAAITMGLSEWELRTGAKLGKYPNFRIGGIRGKIIFDLDLLEARIEKMMLDSIKDEDNDQGYGNLRKVK